jgi:16S rRNA (guanine527-N7)-methyltransferase
MRPAHIADLLEPFLEAPITPNPCPSDPAKAGEESASLSPALLQLISTYIDILIRWNARVNLSAIRDPDQIVTRHFGESLFAARHLFPGSIYGGTAERSSASQGRQISVADVGSGAGFPGLPIKLWAPHISLTLIESNQKKAAFLREVARALTLPDINVTTSRAEALANGAFDLVTLRAVESFAAILPVAASLVAPRGRMALLIGTSQLDPARSVLPQFAWSSPKPIPMSRNRILAVAESPF